MVCRFSGLRRNQMGHPRLSIPFNLLVAAVLRFQRGVWKDSPGKQHPPSSSFVTPRSILADLSYFINESFGPWPGGQVLLKPWCQHRSSATPRREAGCRAMSSELGVHSFVTTPWGFNMRSWGMAERRVPWGMARVPDQKGTCAMHPKAFLGNH